jgi:pyruvate ferredoxin oxidoreductase alpha subunit
MYEILGVASGLRLPILMNIANRALSSPINIHCDHSDSMGVRDSGWIQIYSENPQEVYDHNLLALMLAEAAILPAMVMQDGFITSHSVENVELLPDAKVTSLLGNYRPAFSLLDADNPITVGALQLTDYYFETKRQQVEAMRAAAVLYKETALALSALTKREYPKIEKFNQKGAKRAVIVMSSTAGTAKAAALRFLEETGEKVAVLKIRLFLPFPKKELQEAVKGLKRVAVLDRALSFGSGAPLLKEVKNALFDLPKRPEVTSYVFGLGGREIFEDNIISVFKDLGKNSKTNKENYIGLRE